MTIDNCGAGNGLELIPYQNVEVILGVPAWIAHNGTIQHPNEKKHTKPPSDGWADETFLIKYRIVSANEESGDYIVTAFMGFSAPTGDDGNSNRHGIFTPTIALGKDSVMLTFRAPREFRCPMAAYSDSTCPSHGTQHSSIEYSNFSGPSWK